VRRARLLTNFSDLSSGTLEGLELGPHLVPQARAVRAQLLHLLHPPGQECLERQRLASQLLQHVEWIAVERRRT
jgi:hypothetical protein